MTIQNFYLLAGLLIAVPFWIFIFCKSDKSQHKKILVYSVAFGIVSPIIDYFYSLHDYWHPVLLFGNDFPPIEAALYGFFFLGGISGLVVVAKNLRIIGKPKRNNWVIISYIVTTVLSFFLLVDVLKFNSITAFIAGPMIIGIISLVCLKEKDKLSLHMINGLLTVGLTLILYVIILVFVPDVFEKYWYIGNTMGINLFDIPLEEFVFAFAIGFGTASAYEAIYGLKQRSIRGVSNKRLL